MTKSIKIYVEFKGTVLQFYQECDRAHSFNRIHVSNGFYRNQKIIVCTEFN
jgi:hypothetical protein